MGNRVGQVGVNVNAVPHPHVPAGRENKRLLSLSLSLGWGQQRLFHGAGLCSGHDCCRATLVGARIRTADLVRDNGGGRGA